MNDLQLIRIYYIVDSFCKRFLPKWKLHLIVNNKRGVFLERRDSITISEIITILILFNMSNILYFKSFYLANFNSLQRYFPLLPSYQRFVLLQQKANIPLLGFCRFLMRFCSKRGIYFIDSTPIEVCRNQRIYKHKTFKDIAERGKTSMGWFYGFKAHVVINDIGELVSLQITQGNVHDTKPVQTLTKGLKGMLFADKGYISKLLHQTLLHQGLQLFTRKRKDMKNRNELIPENANFYLKKRGIVETVIGHLKDFKHLVHTKYRSITNFFMNIFSSIVSYQLDEHKPSLGLKLRLSL